MTDPTPLAGDGARPPRPITPGRIAIWVLVAGIGVFFAVSGIVGIVAKG